MVVIPIGEFTMGSADSERGRKPSEGPRRKVTIGDAVALGRTEVTVGDRRFEARLIDLLRSGSTNEAEWRELGPRFFLAGLAVMLASVAGFDRRRYLALAESLHPGASEPRVFAKWLADTPLPPARLLPMVQSQLDHAA